jgi:hypothetical protein
MTRRLEGSRWARQGSFTIEEDDTGKKGVHGSLLLSGRYNNDGLPREIFDAGNGRIYLSIDWVEPNAVSGSKQRRDD